MYGKYLVFVLFVLFKGLNRLRLKKPFDKI